MTDAPKRRGRPKGSTNKPLFAGTAMPAKRGRPSMTVTPADRRIVEEMKFCGESNETIARALGIDHETLVKHFHDNIENGYAAKRLELIKLYWKAARRGVASAMNRLETMSSPAVVDAATKDLTSAIAVKVKAPGKKEQAILDAEGAATGTDWGDDLTPPTTAMPN